MSHRITAERPRRCRITSQQVRETKDTDINIGNIRIKPQFIFVALLTLIVIFIAQTAFAQVLNPVVL